jgi:hypothetical protein
MPRYVNSIIVSGARCTTTRRQTQITDVLIKQEKANRTASADELPDPYGWQTFELGTTKRRSRRHYRARAKEPVPQ